jgi:spore coat protein JB
MTQETHQGDGVTAIMDRQRLLWQMTAEQFAAFDVQLYLDTHPADRHAMNLYEKHLGNHRQYKRDYEAAVGPVTPDTAAANGAWRWVENPWPWEREAN